MRYDAAFKLLVLQKKWIILLPLESSVLMRNKWKYESGISGYGLWVGGETVGRSEDRMHCKNIQEMQH